MLIIARRYYDGDDVSSREMFYKKKQFCSSTKTIKTSNASN